MIDAARRTHRPDDEALDDSTFNDAVKLQDSELADIGNGHGIPMCGGKSFVKHSVMPGHVADLQQRLCGRSAVAPRQHAPSMW